MDRRGHCAAALAAIVCAIAGAAHAHDHWINAMRLHDPVSGAWCCDERDCAAVPAGGVAERSGGYLVVETGELIPYARVIWRSPDGAWWRCRNLATGATRCLIGPPPGS